MQKCALFFCFTLVVLRDAHIELSSRLLRHLEVNITYLAEEDYVEKDMWEHDILWEMT